MNIIGKYSNFLNEIADTIQEKDRPLQHFKMRSVALKTLGAVMMIASVPLAIGVIAAIPTAGISLMALTTAVALAVFGYDFAECGDCMRRHLDNPVSEVVKGGINILKNMWEMGAEKGLRYADAGYFTENTLVISKIIKFIALVVPPERKN